MRRAALFLILFLAGSPWCAAGLFTDDEAQRKIAELQQQVQTLEGRIASLENATRAQGMLDLVSQMEGLKADLAKLRGQIEVQAHDVETTQKRGRDLYVDLDSRLRKLEGGAPSPAMATPVGEQALSAQSQGPAATAANGMDEGKAYEAALNLFKVGNYLGAIAGFQNFIGTHGSSKLVPNAQYWIGNSYFSLRDYKNAIASQQKLVSQYPNSEKVPAALLNISSSQQNLGDLAKARKTLEELVAKYPVSNAADEAKRRLSSLK